jgi:hypothetical protein
MEDRIMSPEMDNNPLNEDPLRRAKSLHCMDLRHKAKVGTPPAKSLGMTNLSFPRIRAGMIDRWRPVLLAAALFAAGGSVRAQGLPGGIKLPSLPRLPQTQQPIIPPAYRPPAGMCRIWIEGVPPGQQAAPTNCSTAVRNRPKNGFVIFGDDSQKGKKEKPKKGKSSRNDSPES